MPPTLEPVALEALTIHSAALVDPTGMETFPVVLLTPEAPGALGSLTTSALVAGAGSPATFTLTAPSSTEGPPVRVSALLLRIGWP